MSVNVKQAEDAILEVREEHEDRGLTADARSRSKVGRRWVGVMLCVALGAGLVTVANWADLARPTTPIVAAGVDPGSADKQPASSTEIVEHADHALGFSIAYPRTWQRVDASGESVVLSVSGSDAVGIRRFSLESPIDASNLADVRTVTDGILDSPKAKLTMLQTEQVRVHNLIGVYYLYYFPFHGGQGVHAHYFLFKGRVMYSLVFQAASASQFEALAPTFDAVSASFKVI